MVAQISKVMPKMRESKLSEYFAFLKISSLNSLFTDLLFWCVALCKTWAHSTRLFPIFLIYPAFMLWKGRKLKCQFNVFEITTSINSILSLNGRELNLYFNFIELFSSNRDSIKTCEFYFSFKFLKLIYFLLCYIKSVQ